MSTSESDLVEGGLDDVVGDREAARVAVGRRREDGAEHAALGVDQRARRELPLRTAPRSELIERRIGPRP